MNARGAPLEEEEVNWQARASQLCNGSDTTREKMDGYRCIIGIEKLNKCSEERYALGVLTIITCARTYRQSDGQTDVGRWWRHSYTDTITRDVRVAKFGRVGGEWWGEQEMHKYLGKRRGGRRR